MHEIVEVTGVPGGECYMVMSGRSAVLIDSGFGFSAERAAENIRSALGGRTLGYILLTHSHYDHAFGCAMIARQFPAAKIACGEYAAKVLTRPGALSLMRLLDDKAAHDAGFAPCGEALPRVDVSLADGQELTLPGMTIRAVATPGHTNCCMSYYFPGDGLLAASETSGAAPGYLRITAAFIASYRMTLESIERSKALNPTRLLIPHTGVFSGEGAGSFFDHAREAAMEAAAFILNRHDRGDSAGEIVLAYRDAYFREDLKRIQPERAFLLNAEAMVTRLLRETGREPSERTA